jgi:hypothetical protein
MNIFGPTVTDSFALKLISDARNGIAVAESDIAAVNKWIVANAPTITTDIQAVIGLAQVAGMLDPAIAPEVSAAAAVAKAAVNVLNAYVATVNSSANTPTELAAGYTAAKNATLAHAKLAIAVAKAPVSHG